MTSIAPALVAAMKAQDDEDAITAEDLQPSEDRILVRRITVEKVGKLVLSEPQKTNFAKVLAIGPGKLLDNGSRAKMRTEVGQVILLPYGVQETKLGDDVVIILREVDVSCHVVRKPKAKAETTCCQAPPAPTA